MAKPIPLPEPVVRQDTVGSMWSEEDFESLCSEAFKSGAWIADIEVMLSLPMLFPYHIPSGFSVVHGVGGSNPGSCATSLAGNMRTSSPDTITHIPGMADAAESNEFDPYFCREGVKDARGGKASLRFKGNPKQKRLCMGKKQASFSKTDPKPDKQGGGKKDRKKKSRSSSRRSLAYDS